jgi:hypothetical protein
MSTQSSSTSHDRDVWSVTLDGHYVVRFCGVNAQELATRQLHELAELLGFEDPPRRAAAKRTGADGIGPTGSRHPEGSQAADQAKRR